MALESVNPPEWSPARGYQNGVLAPAGARMLFIAGQVAWDAEQKLVGGDDFAAQFRQALSNVARVVATAGGQPGDVAQLTVFVTDKHKYAEATREVGAAWREIMGRHFPAMALVEVSGLLETGALVEIQGTAAIGPDSGAVL